MGMQGELNIGQLARERFAEAAVLIGFGTDRGTVTAASEWGGPAEIMDVRSSMPERWGALMREVSEDRFLLDMGGGGERLGEVLNRARPQRFIGVIYRPETERLSHYFQASLARQFDAYIWFETTRAVDPLSSSEVENLPEGHTFRA
jgi:erythromycin esterase-like protein